MTHSYLKDEFKTRDVFDKLMFDYDSLSDSIDDNYEESLSDDMSLSEDNDEETTFGYIYGGSLYERSLHEQTLYKDDDHNDDNDEDSITILSMCNDQEAVNDMLSTCPKTSIFDSLTKVQPKDYIRTSTIKKLTGGAIKSNVSENSKFSRGDLYMLPLDEYPKLPNYKNCYELRAHHERMKTLVDTIVMNEIHPIADVIERFNYLYGIVFTSYNEPVNNILSDLNDDYGYIVIELLFPTTAYINKPKIQKCQLLTQEHLINYYQTTTPKVSKTIKNDISQPSKWYMCDPKNSIKGKTAYKIMIKYDETHCEISNHVLQPREVTILLQGGIIRTSQSLTLTDEARTKLIKEKHMYNNSSYKAKQTIGLAVKQVCREATDLPTMKKLMIEHFEDNYETYPHKISRGVDVEMFKVYLIGFNCNNGIVNKKLMSNPVFASQLTNEFITYVSAFF